MFLNPYWSKKEKELRLNLVLQHCSTFSTLPFQNRLINTAKNCYQNMTFLLSSFSSTFPAIRLIRACIKTEMLVQERNWTKCKQMRQVLFCFWARFEIKDWVTDIIETCRKAGKDIKKKRNRKKEYRQRKVSDIRRKKGDSNKL